MSSYNTNVRVVDLSRANFTQEARQIQTRAERGEAVVVRMGPVLFFCANRDAWMLDPEDGLARCLIRDGEKLPLGINETRKKFSVEWNANYQIDAGVFTYIEHGVASASSIIGYPTERILEYS